MSSNQSEINSRDQYLWREERKKIYSRLAQIGADLSMVFCHDLNKVTAFNQDRILVSCLFDLMPSIDQWKQIDDMCELTGKHIWFVTDNIIDPSIHRFKNVRIHSYPQLLGTSSISLQDFQPRKKPTKLFNCFMQRGDSVRQSWFYFLWLENLIDRGYVSYLLYQLSSYSNLTGADLFEFIHFNKGLDALDTFQRAYDNLKSQVPYRNFPENFDLTVYIQDSKYSLVLETYSTDDDRGQWCLTEKSLRSLQFETVNLLFAQKHTVKIIKNLGFEIDCINEKFDDLPWIARQRKIIDILISDEIVIDDKIKYDQCMHNRSLLNDWKKTYQKSCFFDDLREDICSS